MTRPMGKRERLLRREAASHVRPPATQAWEPEQRVMVGLGMLTLAVVTAGTIVAVFW